MGTNNTQQKPQQKKQQQQTPVAVQKPKSNLPEPMVNPCGIPFKQNKVPDNAELKGLQIRAELSKLGEPSRAFAQHLAQMV